MKNTVTYVLGWDNTSALGLSNLIMEDIRAAETKAGLFSGKDWMHPGRLRMRFHIRRIEDFARLAEFDELLNEFSKNYTDNGFEWEERNSKLRQPRVILVNGTQLFASPDVVSCVTRQREQKVQMAYFNQSAGVRYALNVSHWVIVGEDCHVHKMASIIRGQLRRRNETGEPVADFISRYQADLSTDQIQVYGMDKQGLLAPMIPPRDAYEINMARLNDYLTARNFLPMHQVDFQ